MIKNKSTLNLGIPPLLFITFVENAFKHGIEPAEKECFLQLSLTTDEQKLVFICKNSIEEASTEKAGIGLDNFRRRMELRFPNQHQLTFLEAANEYQATLEVNI